MADLGKGVVGATIRNDGDQKHERHAAYGGRCGLLPRRASRECSSSRGILSYAFFVFPLLVLPLRFAQNAFIFVLSAARSAGDMRLRARLARALRPVGRPPSRLAPAPALSTCRSPLICRSIRAFSAIKLASAWRSAPLMSTGMASPVVMSCRGKTHINRAAIPEHARHGLGVSSGLYSIADVPRSLRSTN